MKKSVLVLTAFATILSSVPSFALVRELASCTTNDGRYEVRIMDNQGIGPDRKSNPVATVLADNDVVASFAVHQQLLQSISFGGHPTYVDNRTNGELFELAGPSTNFHTTSLTVHTQDGQVIRDNLSCTVLVGEAL